MACYENFISDISISPYTFAPRDYAFCDGSTLSIAQNQALFALLGTTFGGNGVNTFQLPDLRGRIPLGAGSFGNTRYMLGAQGGDVSATPATIIAAKPDNGSPTVPVAAPGTIQTLPPYLVLNYIIALSGIWPSQW